MRKSYRTSKGTKRYLKLSPKTGRIVDNQSYKKSHSADIKRRSKSERINKIKKLIKWKGLEIKMLKKALKKFQNG